MSYFDQVFYCNAGDQSTTGYYAVAKRPQNAAVVAGQLVRQFTAPAVNSERVFICIVAGTTANVTDATWALTRGAKTTDGTVTFQECTGASAVNGDTTNTPNWTAAKAIGTPSLGAIIKRNSGASYQICTTAGTMGVSEPSFSDIAGVTTNDGTSVWTSLGPVGNFTGGQAPHARLANACATNWFAAGNTIYVGDNHAESQTISINIAPQGSVNTVGRIICHNRSGSYPPAAGDLTTGALVSTTASANITLTGFGSGASHYFYGLTFKPGVGQSTPCNANISSGGSTFFFERCSFDLASTGVSSISTAAAGSDGVVVFNNVTVKFGSVASVIQVGVGQFSWQNTGPVLVSGSLVPAIFIRLASVTLSLVSLEALDLSQITGAVVETQSSTSHSSLLLKDCKLNAAGTIGTPLGGGATIQLVRSDSAATAYKSARYQYEGTETTETSITRVGGAVDPTGQAQSRKIVATANAQWLRPFKAEPYAAWNAVTGSNVTVTVCGTVNAGALPNNDDIWLEVEYLSSSTTPLGTIVTTTKANLLAANAAVAADGSTWNGGGSGAGWSPFKLVATLNAPPPGMAGYIHARVRAAKPSTVWYIDPQVTLS